ncbi:SDR family NAD(P)-dependent oxidoreductase [Roseivirga sp. BDSF3-8]|uniref:SDR family NAD(P)-dependent oxidoreductase n=1 Tax=Roseivirga sp. BDSF3-8 TaxID=3241598 RepID=UPI0035319B01
MDLQLTGKTAFVSGSTAGIGYAIAKRLLIEGAEVVINGRSQESVDEAIEKLKREVAKAQISGIPADFSNAVQVGGLIERLPDIDILVNNAGIFQPKDFADIPDEDWYRFFDVNVMSGIRLCRAVFPKMLERNEGRIIFISSESGIAIAEEMIHYSMTKTAQLAISRGLAQLAKGTNITVNSVLPGPTRSRGVKKFIEEVAESQDMSVEEAEQDFFTTNRPNSLLQRFIEVDEIANTVAYFASPLSAATNGAAIKAEGGIVTSII